MQNSTRSISCALALAAVTSALSASTIEVVFVDRILAAQANAAACGGDLIFDHLNNQESESMSLDLAVDHTCDAASAAAIARQQSSLGTEAIHAAGECVARGQSEASSDVGASAVNMFQLNVELTAPMPFTITGSIRAAVQAQSNSHANVVFQLTGPAGQILMREILIQSGDDAQAGPFFA